MEEPPSPPGTRRHLYNVQNPIDKTRFFFEHYGLTERDLERYLAAALSAGGDYADLYFEYLSSTSLSMDESMIKSASRGFQRGAEFVWSPVSAPAMPIPTIFRPTEFFMPPGRRLSSRAHQRSRRCRDSRNR